jgi:hypothetical protein
MIRILIFIVCVFALGSETRGQERDWRQTWVQREVKIQIQRSRMGHNQKCPGGYYAGVGFSTRGPAAAVRQCCYWYGTKRPAGVNNFGRFPRRWFHVERGRDGRWYAAALFKG